MGQGLFIKVAQVVAEEFGVAARPRADHRDHDRARCRTPRRPPPRPAPTSTAWRRRSRPATIKARLVGVRRRELRTSRRSRSSSATTACSSATSRCAFAELVAEAYLARVSLSVDRLLHARRRSHWDRGASATGRPFFYFAYGAACSEVAIDTLTGEMKVLARRHPPRRRPLAQSGDRHRPDRGRLRAGHGLADDRGAGVRRRRAGCSRHAPSTYKIPCASDVPERFRDRALRTARTARTRSTAPRRSASRR